MNVVSNILGFLAIALVVIGIMILFTISSQFQTSIQNIYENVSYENGTLNDATLVSNAYKLNEDTTNIIADAMNFFLIVFFALTIFSSFTQKNSIVSYFIMFIVSVVVASFTNYLVVEFYNAIITSSIIDLTRFPTWFFNNLNIIILANVVAAGLSFLFVQKEGGVE
jgi:phosphotransferase system  glucose/maltose/N-acetylglucosamine-specific IIC component